MPGDTWGYCRISTLLVRPTLTHIKHLNALLWLTSIKFLPGHLVPYVLAIWKVQLPGRLRLWQQTSRWWCVVPFCSRVFYHWREYWKAPVCRIIGRPVRRTTFHRWRVRRRRSTSELGVGVNRMYRVMFKNEHYNVLIIERPPHYNLWKIILITEYFRGQALTAETSRKHT